MVYFKKLGMNMVKDGMSWAKSQTKNQTKTRLNKTLVQLST